MRLSRYEKETIILLNAAEDTASIYTADPVWKRKLDKLVEKNPQCYQCVKADEVSKTYSMPKRFISLRSKEKTVIFDQIRRDRYQRKKPLRSQRSRKNGQNRDCRGRTNEGVLGAFYASKALFQ